MRKNNSNMLTQSSVMFNKSEAQYKPFKFTQLKSENKLNLQNVNLTNKIMNKNQILEINKNFRSMQISELSLSDLQKLIIIFQISAKYYSESQLRKKAIVENKYEFLMSQQNKLENLQKIRKQHQQKKKDIQNEIQKLQLEIEQESINSDNQQVVFVKCHICGRKQIEKNILQHLKKHTNNQENQNTQNFDTQKVVAPENTMNIKNTNPLQNLRQSEFIQKIAEKLSKEIDQKLENLQLNKPPKTPQLSNRAINNNSNNNNFNIFNGNISNNKSSQYIKDSIVNMNQMFNNFQNLFNNLEDKQSIISNTNQCESQILVSDARQCDSQIISSKEN